MFLNNNTYLLTNFEQIFDILSGNKIDLSYQCKFFYENKLALQHLILNNEIKENENNINNNDKKKKKKNIFKI